MNVDIGGTKPSSEARPPVESATPACEGKTYYGRRNADGSGSVWIVDDHAKLLAGGQVNDAATRDLPLRLDLRNHSPTGLSWGYEGSGPAQLALALLADCFGDEVAQRFYQPFKRAVVSRLPEAGWTLTARQIRESLAQLVGGETPFPVVVLIITDPGGACTTVLLPEEY